MIKYSQSVTIRACSNLYNASFKEISINTAKSSQQQFPFLKLGKLLSYKKKILSVLTLNVLLLCISLLS